MMVELLSSLVAGCIWVGACGFRLFVPFAVLTLSLNSHILDANIYPAFLRHPLAETVIAVCALVEALSPLIGKLHSIVRPVQSILSTVAAVLMMTLHIDVDHSPTTYILCLACAIIAACAVRRVLIPVYAMMMGRRSPFVYDVGLTAAAIFLCISAVIAPYLVFIFSLTILVFAALLLPRIVDQSF